jgi:thiamine-monophosphate kinase
VTGTIGDGALGLLVAQGKLDVIDADHCAFLEDCFRRPTPRVSAGQALVGQAHACLDISDGLVQDLSHMADASGVSIRLDAASVPLSPAAQVALNTDPQLLSIILSGGDDYELLISAAKMPTGLDVMMTEIGTVVTGPAFVFIQGKDGEEISLTNTGYNHFK